MWMKKRYVLNNGGEHFTAEVATHRDGRIAVQLDDGELREVDACWVQNGRALSLRVDGRMHLIDLTATGQRGGLAATVNGRHLDLTVMDELRALAQQSVESAASGGSVPAEIPGIVVSLAVTVGQKVHQGDALLVLEAMKMQNEIVAPVTGTVDEIKVEVGQSVSQGDVMVMMTAEAGG